MSGSPDELIAGARLWDRMARREPIVFGPRTPDREGVLLVLHQDGTNAYLPSVTVATDSLANPGRGLITMASAGKFSCFHVFMPGNLWIWLFPFDAFLHSFDGEVLRGGGGFCCLLGVHLGVVCGIFPIPFNQSMLFVYIIRRQSCARWFISCVLVLVLVLEFVLLFLLEPRRG